MNKYKIMLNGQNFVIDLGEGQEKYGFYTTLYAHANSKAEAENIAIESIHKINTIKDNIKNADNDPPILYAEEIIAIENDELEQALELSWFKEAF